ncbi:2-dehydropantoate 2-reductase [Candidatus Woesearchaeota archaeon]|nr:2-dehydropantoate 2-reductase [Candidatus Woesearchaeota archaeon]
MTNKIAIMGAGAVGSYYGALLIRAGFDVILIARGKHLEAMKKNGLSIKSFKGDFRVDVNATDNPEEISPVDFILFTVKSYDTETAISQIKPIIHENTLVMSLQNGIDNDEKIEKVVGKGKLIPALTKIGVSIPEPGIINHSAKGIIIFNESNGEKTKRIKQIEDIFKKANIEYNIPKDILLEKWKKFLWNSSFNVITAITKKTLTELLNSEMSNELINRSMKEVIAIAQKKNILLGHEIIQTQIDFSRQLGNFKTSMLQDIEKGKRIESWALSGIISKLGKELGIDTPVNETLYYLLKIIGPKDETD